MIAGPRSGIRSSPSNRHRNHRRSKGNTVQRIAWNHGSRRSIGVVLTLVIVWDTSRDLEGREATAPPGLV